MAACCRVLAICGCTDRDVVCGGAGQPRCGRRLDKDEAQRLLGFTSAIGGKIAAAEFVNEPDLAPIGGLPKTYDAAAYGRDFKLFHSLIRRTTPGTMILGPATIGVTATAPVLLAATAGALDAVSYHYYPTLSQRCGGRTSPEATLSEQ